MSPGTLYPVLHKLEEQRLLESSRKNVAGKMRKYYRITAAGRTILADGVEKACELIDQIGGTG